MPDTSVFPAASSKAGAEAPTSSAGAASTSVLGAAPATGGTVFPTTSVGTARAPASDDGTVESAAEPAISGTVPSAASVRGEIGRRESFAGVVPSNAAAEAGPSTGDTAAPVESAAWAARKLASATGSAGDRWVANTCGESGASTHPFDPGTVFPPEVRYSTHRNVSSSSNSRGNNSSCSSNDTTSNHDSWWEATYVGALLRPFDPGKGCERDARIGAFLGVDLPFDRGKA